MSDNQNLLTNSVTTENSSSSLQDGRVDAPGEETGVVGTASVSSSVLPDDGLGALSGATSAEDVFYGQYKVYFPRFAILLNGLSNNKLRQLIKNLVSGPLATRDYQPITRQEKELFIIGSKLLFSRFTLEFQELAKLAEQAQTEKVSEGVSQGENTTDQVNTTVQTNLDKDTENE
jgi:hypothetical protein